MRLEKIQFLLHTNHKRKHARYPSLPSPNLLVLLQCVNKPFSQSFNVDYNTKCRDNYYIDEYLQIQYNKDMMKIVKMRLKGQKCC